MLPRISAEKLIIKEILRLGATEKEARAEIIEMNLLDNMYGYEKVPHSSSIVAKKNININVNVNNNINTSALNVVVKNNNADEIMENTKSIISKININDKLLFDVPASAENVLMLNIAPNIYNILILDVPTDADNTLILDVPTDADTGSILDKNIKPNILTVIDDNKKLVKIYKEIRKTLIFMFLIFLFMKIIAFKICKIIVKITSNIFLKVCIF